MIKTNRVLKRILPKLLCICIALCMLLSINPTVSAYKIAEELALIAVAKTDIKDGERLGEENVALVEVKAANLPPNVISDISQIVGKFANEDLNVGEYIYANQLTDKDKAPSAELLRQEIIKSGKEFIIVSDYLTPDTGEDVTAYLQRLIDKNGARTLYFPDGEYVISSPLRTSAAAGQSTTFYFSGGAVLKASDDWKPDASNGRNAMICIGGDYSGGRHENDNTSNTSYFGVFGGTFDCNNKAEGIAIISSRESVIYGCTIKNPLIGINIHSGANNTSSDADIENVTIYGSNQKHSVGINVVGADNTITDVTIYDMQTGVYSGTTLVACKNIRCIQSDKPEYQYDYEDNVGFNGCGWLIDCYVENYATAYILRNSSMLTDSLMARWTGEADTQTAFQFASSFNSRLTHCTADFFYTDEGECVFLKSSNNEYGDRARIDSPILNTGCETSGFYEKFVDRGKNGIINLADY